MIPPKYSVFTNIRKNIAETLQFEELAVKNLYHFYYVHIFVKKSWISIKCIFLNVVEEKKLKKKKIVEKIHSVFEGLKGALRDTKTFFSAKYF